MRNQSVAYIFATELFHFKPILTMRRDVIKSIADPTRRVIIGHFTFQAMTPNAIAAHFDTSRQSVSEYIQMLTKCKLGKQELHGREVYDPLNAIKMIEMDKWLEYCRKIWETKFNPLDHVLLTIKKQVKK